MQTFGGGDREQFREWARKLTEIMQQLRPGARQILKEIETSDNEIWDKYVHEETFRDSMELKDMYQTLNEEMWWILSIKTTGATQGMVVAVPDGMGLEAFRKYHHTIKT